MEGRLLEQRLPELRRYARSLTGRTDEADDLVQQWLQQRSWAGRPAGRLELFKSLRACFLAGRQERPAPGTALQESTRRWLGRGSTRRPDGSTDLRSAYRRLPRKQREVLNLVVMDGMSYEQAGAILDVSPRAVGTMVAEARAELIRRLDGSDTAAVA